MASKTLASPAPATEPAAGSRPPVSFADIAVWLWPALALLVLIPIYLRPNFGWYHDGVMNAAYVMHGPWEARVHPHHLLYNTSIWVIWQMLGEAVNPLHIMSWIGRIAALGCIVQTGVILTKLKFTPGWVAAAMLIFGSGFTTWSYATNAAVYLPSLFWLLTIYSILLGWSDKGPSKRDMWLVAGCYVAAVVYHQLALIVVVPVALWAWWTSIGHADKPLRIGWQMTGMMLGPVIALYAIALTTLYGPAIWLHPEAIARWATRYGRFEHHWIWHKLEGEPRPLIRWGKMIAESHARMVWAMPFGERFLAPTDHPIAQAIQRGFGADSFWTMIKLMLLPLTALTLWGTWRVWRIDSPRAWGLILAAGWSLPFVVFSAVFEPQNAFYRLYYFVPWLFILLAPFALHADRISRVLGGSILALYLLFTLTVNYGWGWQPRTNVESNPPLAGIEALGQLPEGPLVFQAVEDQFEEFMFTRIYVDRPVYHSQWKSEVDLSELGAGMALAAQVEGPLWVQDVAWDRYRSLPAVEGEDSLQVVLVRYVYLRDVQGSREEPTNFWIDLEWYNAGEPVELGHYAFVPLTLHPDVRTMAP